MFTKALVVFISLVAIGLAGTSVWENRQLILRTSSTGCHGEGCTAANSCAALKDSAQVSEKNTCCKLQDQSSESVQASPCCAMMQKLAASQTAGRNESKVANDAEISWE